MWSSAARTLVHLLLVPRTCEMGWAVGLRALGVCRLWCSPSAKGRPRWLLVNARVVGRWLASSLRL